MFNAVDQKMRSSASEDKIRINDFYHSQKFLNLNRKQITSAASYAEVISVPSKMLVTILGNEEDIHFMKMFICVM